MTIPSTPGSDLVADCLSQLDVLLPAHVLGEDAKQLVGGEIADIGELGYCTIELARCEGGDHCAGAIVQSGGDGAAGAQQSHVGQIGSAGKLLLRDLVEGFLETELFDLDDAIDMQTDVVSGLELHHQVQVVVGLAAGQDDAFEDAPLVVDDAHIAPDPHAPGGESFAGESAIALQGVVCRFHFTSPRVDR